MSKRKVIALGLMVALVGGLAVLAEKGTEKSKKWATLLAKAMQKYPEADLNQDGRLTMDEGLAFLKKHPELREELLSLDDPADRAWAEDWTAKSAAPSETGGEGVLGPRVFVCGHSYMIYTAELLPKLARSAQIPYVGVGRQMLGGSRVIQHWELPESKNVAKRKLSAGEVDVLMLSPNATLPDEGINHFTKLGLEKQPHLRVLVQASWAPRDGRSGGNFANAQRDAVTVEQLQEMRRVQREGWLRQLEKQVGELNASLNAGRKVVGIVPVFDAVYALRERVAGGTAPGIIKQSELFKDDHGHPSPVLELLVSYCHYAAIHQRSPEGLPLPEVVRSNPQAEALNRLLQELAWQAVSAYPESGIVAAE